MATVSFTATGSSPVELPLRQFDADEYSAMAVAGVFDSRRRVELVGGYVVEMSPAGPRHNYLTMRFPRVFAPLLVQFELSIQGTLRVDRKHVLDPDLMLVRPREDKYRDTLPTPSDVALILEVSDSSIRRDADVKMPIYAAAEIPEYWIANLEREALIVHRQPRNGVYEEVREYTGDCTVSPIAAPEFSIRVANLFG
jgi:Uma2 family endonuclease